MRYETAGDPMTGLLWTRKTLDKVCNELAKAGISVSAKTVSKLMKDLGYSLKCNSKKVSNGGRKLSKKEQEAIDEQFSYIAQLREKFSNAGCPILSCDTKKKELIGNFKNSGTRYRKESDLVNDHDFVTYAIGKAIPYGLYDPVRNEGFVYVAEALYDKKDKSFTSSDTPEFAASCIARWWKDYGSQRYPKSTQILVLVDAGGSNAYRSHMWKLKLYEMVSQKLGLTVTVCHYPPGKSKWNPIEHRLFSEISKTWQATPLQSFETVINYIRNTTTTTGLRVMARLVRKRYRKGQSLPKRQLDQVPIKTHQVAPAWNYTIMPEAQAQ